MSIETIEQTVEEVISNETPLLVDFGGFSTLFVVLLVILFIRPIITLLMYGVAALIIFAVVKSFV